MPSTYPTTYRRTAISRGFQPTERAPVTGRYRPQPPPPLQQIESNAAVRALPDAAAAAVGMFGERLYDMLTQDYPASPFGYGVPYDYDPPAPLEDINSRSGNPELDPWTDPAEDDERIAGKPFEDGTAPLRPPLDGGAALTKPAWTNWGQCPSPAGTGCAVSGWTIISTTNTYDNSGTCVGLGACPIANGVPVPYSAGMNHMYEKLTLRRPTGSPDPNLWINKQWVLAAGQDPLPLPERKAVPIVPVAGEIQPEGDFELDNFGRQQVTFPNPWSLPVRNPGEVENPRNPFPQEGVPRPGIIPTPANPDPQPSGDPAPRPQPRPQPEPTPIPSPVFPPVGWFVSIDAQGRPSFAQRASINPRPPRANERELKPKSGKAALMFKAMVNLATEWRDFVRSLWQALPDGARRNCKAETGHKCKIGDMIMDIGDALYRGEMSSEEYWRRALTKLITNEIQDHFFGRSGKLYKSAADKIRENYPGMFESTGFQTGSGYRPQVDSKLVKDDKYLERGVRAAVDTVFGS